MISQNLASKVASRSKCRYRIAAIALDKKGQVLGYACNQPRFAKLHGGLHAEMAVLRKVNVKQIQTIIIARTNKIGDLLPIHPCETCLKVCSRLGIKIKTIERGERGDSI